MSSSPQSNIFSELASIPGVRPAPFPNTFVPMLAALSETAFTRTGWIYEPKMDGIRGVTLFQEGKTRILSRRNLDLTSQYPSLSIELAQLLQADAIVDGEIIALNESGRPSFQHLQQRMNLTRDADVQRAEQMVPAYYFVFDIMQIGGFSLLGVKLSDRKKLLKMVLKESSRVRLLQHFEDDGVLAYEACVDNGFEGIVAKRLEAVYEPGRRSPSWIKLKAQQTAEFVLGGFTPGEGWRASTFGSLLLGYYNEAGKFIYAGSVGTGFDDRLLRETMRRIDPLRSNSCPFLNRPVEKRDALWLQPSVIVEIKFMDWTRDGHLRTPVFLRFRDDKIPTEIMRERPVAYVPGSDVANSTQDDTMVRAKAAAAIRARRLGNATSEDPAPAAPLPNDKSTAASVEDRLVSTGLSRSESKSSDLTGAKSREKEPKVSVQKAETPATATSKSYTETPPQSAPVAVSLPPFTEADRLALLARAPAAVTDNVVALADVESVVSQLSGKEKQIELIVQREKIALTNLDKILWPETTKHPRISKRDYLRTMALLSPYLLSYIHNRPLTLVRSPEGVKGKRFYQKHWNFTAPEFMDTVTVCDEGTESGLQEYLLCNNLATLIFLAQNGVVEYHVFTSSLSTQGGTESYSSANGAAGPEVESRLNHPDQLVFDLDMHLQSEKTKARPMDEGAFEKTRAAALMLRDVFLSMGLIPFVKTSGKNGIHVVLPIERNVEFDVVRFVADVIRQYMGKAHKEQIALDTESARRSGRVFLDHGPNGNGRTVVAPYSPRFAPEATVSCPVTWDQLEKLDPASFNLSSIVQYMLTAGDPWSGIRDRCYDLQTVFQKK